LVEDVSTTRAFTTNWAGLHRRDTDGVATGVAAVRHVDQLMTDPQAKPGIGAVRR
jgi:hypothetical protein